MSSLIMAQHLKLGNGREEHGFFLNPCNPKASGASCISCVTSAQTILGFSIAVTAEERTEPSSATLFSEATSHKPLRKRHVCDHHCHLNWCCSVDSCGRRFGENIPGPSSTKLRTHDGVERLGNVIWEKSAPYKLIILIINESRLWFINRRI